MKELLSQYLADWRQKPLLRPGFRISRRDFIVLGLVLLVFLPVAGWAYWAGGGFLALMASVIWFIWGGPFVGIILLAIYKSTWKPAQVSARILLQIIVLTVLLIPINLMGREIHQWSTAVTIERGNEIVSHLNEYRQAKEMYPESLEELEAWLGKPLPRPSLSKAGRQHHFWYEESSSSFSLGFYGGGMIEIWEYDTLSQKWVRD